MTTSSKPGKDQAKEVPVITLYGSSSSAPIRGLLIFLLYYCLSSFDATENLSPQQLIKGEIAKRLIKNIFKIPIAVKQVQHL